MTDADRPDGTPPDGATPLDATPLDAYASPADGHAALLGRVHQRGRVLRRRRRAAVGSAALAAAALLAVPFVAAAGDDGPRETDVAAGCDGPDCGPGEASATSSPVATSSGPSTTGQTAECDPALACGSTTTSSVIAPTTTTQQPTTTPPPTSAPPSDPSAPTTTSVVGGPTTTTTRVDQPGRATCADGSTGDTVVWVSNQSFATPTQRIEVRVDGALVVADDFAVGNQHDFQMFCLDLGSGTHEVVARSTGAEATVRASPGNGVVVLGLDGGEVTVDVAPRWDEVGFA